MTYYLRQVTSGYHPIIVPLTEAEVVVGTNIVELQKYPQISQYHAKFFEIQGRIYMRNLDNRYGTYVNGIRVGSKIRPLSCADVIGFGVNAKSTEYGFVCNLVRELFEDSFNARRQPERALKKKTPEIIDLSNDDDVDMSKICINSVKTVSSTSLDFKTFDVQENTLPIRSQNGEISFVPSTSSEHIFVKKRYFPTKKCLIPLIRCESENFLWPPDVKNPNLLELEDDEDILKKRKKRPTRLISDSSVESFEGYTSSSFVKKTESEQNMLNNSGSESSSRKHSSDGESFKNRRKKPARIISSDSSDESSIEFNNSIHRKSQKSFPNHLKTESISSSGFVTLIAKQSSNRNVSLNSANDSNKETVEPSSSKPCQANIQKTEVGKKLWQIPSNFIRISRTAESHLEEDSRHKPFKEIDCYSVADEIIDVSDDDDYFDIDTVQNFTKTESKEIFENDDKSEDPGYYSICKDIFEGGDETEDVPLNAKSVNSVLENHEVESIERIQHFVNCSVTKNSVQSESRGSKELNSTLTDAEPKVSLDESFLPGMKNYILQKTSGVKKSLKSSGKTLLTAPKPMKHRPRKMRGRDEGYVERPKPIEAPKRKRGRPRKEEQLQRNTVNINSVVNIAKIPNNVDERYIPLKNSKLEKLGPLSKGKDTPAGSSGAKNVKLPKNPLPMTKPIQHCPLMYMEGIEDYSERQKSINPLINSQIGRTENCSELEHEESNRDLPENLPGNNQNWKEKIPVHDYCKSRILSVSTNAKASRSTTSSVKRRPDKFSSRMAFLINPEKTTPVRKGKISGKAKKYKGVSNAEKNNISQIDFTNKDRTDDLIENKSIKKAKRRTTSSVKRRPDKFSSRMAFLINPEKTTPVIKDKISGKVKKYKGVSNTEKNDVSQIDFANKVGTDDLIQNKTIKKASKNASPVSRIEDKHPEQKKKIERNFSHTLQNNNLEDSTFQKSPHFFLDASSTRTLHVKNVKENNFQNIPHSSAGASSSHTLQAKKVENSIFQNIPRSSTNAFNRISVPREYSQLPFELSFNGMVKSLLKLNTIWLQEQRYIPDPPAEVIQGVQALPLSFASYNSYALYFYPLLKLEIWQSMFEASKEILPNKKLVKRFSFRALSFVNKPDCIELKCESIVNNKYHFEPREGMMTVLEMNVNSHQSYPSFGFIFKHKVNPLDLNLLHPCWKKTSGEYLKDAKHWIFHAWIKQKELFLGSDILMKGNGICYLRNRLRLVDALRCFKDSPLMTDIIKPRLQTFSLTCKNSSSNREYTSRQFEIIQAVCSEICKPNLECKITLIHRPPGTAETHIVVGILRTLFYEGRCNSNLKVLVTAPSNVAVDEIGRRLIELDRQYGSRDYTVKFVRVGVEKHVHSEMLPYYIDRKAADLHKMTVQSSKQKERELQALRLKILNFETEPDSLNKRKLLKSLNEQYKFIEDSFSLKKVHYLTEIKYKCDILKESHIVLTTLSSCNLSVLCKTFLPTSKSNSNFTCCIVDESTQCTELEILQPLALGINKLILVGDDKQLFTAAHLEYTKKYLFNRSMLERFCHYFESTEQPSPVVSFTEEFRMHPSIYQFPSTFMYDKKLDNCSETILMHEEFPLKPYIILDFANSRDSSSETIKDCDILFCIYSFLAKVVDSSSSIGVIVPHDSQRYFYTRFLHALSHFSDVEVNTINGFQEKDIVILYAIKSNFHATDDSFITCTRKFDVALTRARNCLIICLDSSTLLEHQHWKRLIFEGKERNICFKVTSLRTLTWVLEYSRK